jgi:hypothetical protein
MLLTPVTGSFGGLFCNNWDGQRGCTGFGAVENVFSDGYVYRTSSSPLSLEIQVGSVGTPNPQIFFGHVTFSHDSLYGSVYWQQTSGRSPPRYDGTFVALRRK